MRTIDYRPGMWQVVDFRFKTSPTVIWDRPPVHLNGADCTFVHQSEVMVIVFGRGDSQPIIFIHEDLLDGHLVGPTHRA